jgi:xyloglucan-specific endo-beta-1,4-glucanase
MIERTCEHGGTIRRGHFLLSNNLWGASTGRGSQCLWAEPGSIAWGTEWSWEGNADTVKSYVACTLGWHWGWPLPGGPLPAALASLAAVRSEWRFGLTAAPGSRLNVTYDAWLADVEDPADGNPTDEVMIWLRREGGATPIGRRRDDVEVEGAAWELWSGPHPERGWTVHSFVRTEPAVDARLDLLRFFEAVRPDMPKAIYLVGIEAGTEVFTGTGRLETTRFTIDFVR